MLQRKGAGMKSSFADERRMVVVVVASRLLLAGLATTGS
jgi:hypothetical protein